MTYTVILHTYIIACACMHPNATCLYRYNDTTIQEISYFHGINIHVEIFHKMYCPGKFIQTGEYDILIHLR